MSNGLRQMQSRIALWRLRMFGPDLGRSILETSKRVVEEALELAQASGVSREDALRLVDYVYGRPPGELSQEAAGTLVSLLGWAGPAGVDLQAVTLQEIERIHEPTVQIRILDKQHAKAAAGVGGAPP